MTGEVSNPSLADRIDRLFRTVRRRDERTGDLREYTLREVADAITADGEPISHSYIAQLRTGKKDNPDLKRMRALAKFFGVPVEYLTSDQLATEVNYELDLVAALQELQARRVALRDSVLSQTEEATRALAEVMQHIRDMERGRASPG